MIHCDLKCFYSRTDEEQYLANVGERSFINIIQAQGNGKYLRISFRREPRQLKRGKEIILENGHGVIHPEQICKAVTAASVNMLEYDGT